MDHARILLLGRNNSGQYPFDAIHKRQHKSAISTVTISYPVTYIALVDIYEPASCMIFRMALPIWAGDFTTVTPAPSSDEILSCAVPFPPEMMAPAWPILLPGGAVSPALIRKVFLSHTCWIQ